jgi:hypothetical protein
VDEVSAFLGDLIEMSTKRDTENGVEEPRGLIILWAFPFDGRADGKRQEEEAEGSSWEKPHDR